MPLWHCQSKMGHGYHGMAIAAADGLGRLMGPRGEDNSKAVARSTGEPEF